MSPVSGTRPGLLAACLLALLAGQAWGQLDLPKNRRKRSSDRPARVLPKPHQKGDLAPKSPYEPAPLDLRPGSDPVADALEAAPDDAGLAAGRSAARFVFEELARSRDPSSSMALAAVDSIGALGAPGLEVAREELAVEKRMHAARLVVAGRVLLVHGRAEDRALVAERMRQKLPGKSCAFLLEELLARDPVLASPAYLAGLLDHPTSAMRGEGQEILLERADASTLPYLVEVLASRRSQTRELALDVVAEIDDPSALNVLFEYLGDRNAAAARRASELLAQSGDTELVPRLRALALEDGPSRSSAYAQLTLVAIEDLLQTPLFGDADAASLVPLLDDPLPVVAGAAATVLAGIGFRSTGAIDTGWLDDRVPHTLVLYATGDVFHSDFTSLQHPGIARLALLSGESFGGNGQAWQMWWADHAAGFRARRAVLPLGPGSELQLRVVLERSDGEVLELVGPERAAAHEGAAREPTYLTAAEAAALLGTLEAEGLFGAERLPGRRGPRGLDGGAGDGELRLALDVRGVEKAFAFRSGLEEPWFERSVASVRAVAEAGRWQRWHDPREFDTAFVAWVAARDEWALASAAERDRLLVELVLTRARLVPPAEREPALDELDVLYARGAAWGSDFPHLLELLADEEVFGAGARRLTELAFTAAAAVEGGPHALEPSLARMLAETLVERFESAAFEAVGRILAAGGSELVLEAASSEAIDLRAASAFGVATLASDPADRERAGVAGALLDTLLADRALAVRVQAVQAADEFRVQAAREPLRRMVGAPEPVLRAAALRGLGSLGGPDVRELCVLGLSDTAPEVQEAAVEALADLEDPAATSILLTLFRRGPDSPLFPAARRGLRALPEPPKDELLRLLPSSTRELRRQAAFLLSEWGEPGAASELLLLITEDPADVRVAQELAVLSCVDLRDPDDPGAAVQGWWDWWDLVVHDDSLAWLCGAVQRASGGPEIPEPAQLAGRGTESGARFLVALLFDRTTEWQIVERARRELERLLQEPVPRSSNASADERSLQREGLEKRIGAHYQS